MTNVTLTERTLPNVKILLYICYAAHGVGMATITYCHFVQTSHHELSYAEQAYQGSCWLIIQLDRPNGWLVNACRFLRKEDI